jgi:hypothetical protein
MQKNEKVWTIIGAPHRMYHSTLANAVTNAHRGVWVKTGRQADAEYQARASKRQKLNSVFNEHATEAGKACNNKEKGAPKPNSYVFTAPGKHSGR